MKDRGSAGPPQSQGIAPAAVDPRRPSLLRATLLVLGSLLAAMLMAGLSGEPSGRASLRLAFPAVTALLGFADTFRCLRQRWNLYHGAVVILLYMDVMAVTIILFLLFYPYGEWIM